MHGETVCSRFVSQVERSACRVAMRDGDGGEGRDSTWGQYGEAVGEVARGLSALGIVPGEAVALLSRNRPEWHIADIGAMCAGATTVPIYLSNSPPQVA